MMPAKSSIALLLALALPMPVASAANFYEGKNVRLIVGSDVGGGFDTVARLVARHYGRHVPGNPTFIVQNMPGAGSAKAAAFVYSAAEKDGTIVAALNPGGLVAPLFEGRNTGFEAARFQYIASADTTARVCFTLKNSKVKTFADAQKNETVIGAGAVGSSSYDYALMHQQLNGAKFKVVSGYKGMADILLALERGEVDGLCGYDWSGLKAVRPNMIKDGFNYLLQVTVEPVPELDAMNVPNASTFANNETDRAALELIAGQQMFGRPYALAPEVPKDRVQLLRAGFVAMAKDKDFLIDADKLQMSIDVASGADVQALIERMYAAPREVVERAKKAIRP